MFKAILEQREKVVLQNADKPVIHGSQVLIKVKRIGICGSDIHAYYGKHPYISCPIVQGHEFSGEIVETGEKVSYFKIGDDVTVMPQMTCGTCYSCRHGNYHICNTLKVIGCQVDGAAQEYFAVKEELVIRLPEGMSYDFGAMIEPVTVGVHAMSRLGDVTGMNIIVFGAGPIGNLTAQVAKGLGANSVMITDLSDYRLGIASQCGIDYTVNVSKDDLVTAIDELWGENRADAMLECVGVQSSIEHAIKVSRKGTDIIIVGVFGQKPTVDLGLVQDKELRLIGTLMYKEQDYHIAIDLIKSGKIKLEPLISKYFTFQHYSDAYKFIEQNREETMKVIIDMEG